MFFEIAKTVLLIKMIKMFFEIAKTVLLKKN